MTRDELLEAILRDVAEPQRARPDAERLLDVAAASQSGASVDALTRVIGALCGNAPFLVAHFERHDGELAALLQDDLQVPLDPSTLADALSRELAASPAPDAATALRRFKYRHLARIAVRDCAPGVVPLARSGGLFWELTALATALLGAALHTAQRRIEARLGPPRFVNATGRSVDVDFCVLGLGKLGATELNFSSDVDLVYLHSAVAGGARTARGDSAAEYFARLARELAALVETHDGEGFLYRIDLDLRPEGRRGPLVLSETALLDYFEVRADAWEKAAFAKARPVAGAMELGWRAVRALDPHIYRTTMDWSALQSIRHLGRRVTQKRGEREGSFDVKLDPGGIRDIEFAAQALQLLHGGRIPQIRVRSTERALVRLAEVKLLPEDRSRGLLAAYRLLRRLENRLQMWAEQQTHRLELDPTSLARWAGALRGLAPTEGEAFGAMLSSLRADVSEFADSLLPGERPEASPDAVLDLFSRHQPRLFALPESRTMMEQLAGQWTHAIAASGDPELALNNLDRFIAAVGGRRFYYELLLDRPELVPRLTALFASSRFLSDLLARHPRLLEPLFDDPHRLLLSRAELRRDLAELRRGLGTGPDEDVEADLAALRLFHHRQVLNIGLLDVAERVGRRDAEGSLSDLAETCLARALALAERRPGARGAPAAPTGSQFLVVGMGKLASRELSYGSDLDLIFLYHLPEATAATRAAAQEFYSRLAQRLVSILQSPTAEGRCYEIDLRLRPSGGQGSLVTSLAAFHRYHAEAVQPWERQALLRARGIAGSPALAERFEGERRAALRRPTEPDLAGQIHHIRMRMERELTPRAPGRRDLKTGRGGLLDVENAVQYLQLRHGAACESLLRPEATEAQIAELASRGFLTADRAQTLAEGFAFLKLLSNRLRLVENRSISDFDSERSELAGLAHHMGYRRGPPHGDPRRALLRDYEHHAEAVRAAYLEVLELRGAE